MKRKKYLKKDSLLSSNRDLFAISNVEGDKATYIAEIFDDNETGQLRELGVSEYYNTGVFTNHFTDKDGRSWGWHCSIDIRNLAMTASEVINMIKASGYKK